MIFVRGRSVPVFSSAGIKKLYGADFTIERGG